MGNKLDFPTTDVLVITDRFMKLVCNVPLGNVSATEVAKQFVNDCKFSYGPPIELIADNELQFSFSKTFGRSLTFKSLSRKPITDILIVKWGDLTGLNCPLSAPNSLINPRYWYLYTSISSYAYSCQPQIYFSRYPFQTNPDLYRLKSNCPLGPNQLISNRCECHVSRRLSKSLLGS